MLISKNQQERDGLLENICNTKFDLPEMKKLIVLCLPFFVMAQTEMQSYNVVKTLSKIEIRFYPPVMMAKHTASGQRSGFGKLFGYISGNNDQNSKIAMTTPVHMENTSTKSSMAFVLPKKFNNENTPLPDDKTLSVYQDQGGYYAAIKYSGYTNSSKEMEYTGILNELLEKEKINPTGLPKVLVYDSPYKIINRRNEILIPIKYSKDD